MRKINPVNALFGPIKQEILAATYGQPERWWFLSELAAHAKKTPSSLQRELKSLATSGILRTRRDGNRLYFQAESDSPIFGPLRDLVKRTLGISEGLKDALDTLADKIDLAFIYGSVARQDDHTLSDVDLVVIGRVRLSDLSTVLRPLEKTFGREFNATCYDPDEFAEKVKSGSHFVTSLLMGEKQFVIGGDDDLDGIIGKPNGTDSYD